jgi:hypothetical protein
MYAEGLYCERWQRACGVRQPGKHSIPPLVVCTHNRACALAHACKLATALISEANCSFLPLFFAQLAVTQQLCVQTYLRCYSADHAFVGHIDLQSAGSQRVDLQRTYKQLSASRAAHALRFAAVYTDGGCDGMPDDLTYWVSSSCLQDTTVPAVAEASKTIRVFADKGSSKTAGTDGLVWDTLQSAGCRWQLWGTAGAVRT